MNSTWRRRLCKQCSALFTTEEKPDLSTVWLVESADGQVSKFSRDKLFISILDTLAGSEKALSDAGVLSDTVIKSLLKSHRATLSTRNIQDTTEAVLSRFNALAALKYVSRHSTASSKRDVAKKLKNLPMN